MSTLGLCFCGKFLEASSHSQLVELLKEHREIHQAKMNKKADES